MLCTKSPNRFRYADNFDSEFVEIDFELSSCNDAGAGGFSEPRERSPPAEAGDAIPEACTETCATDSAIEHECG